MSVVVEAVASVSRSSIFDGLCRRAPLTRAESVINGLPFSTMYVANSAAGAAADVLDRVHRVGRDHQGLARLHRQRRLTVDRVLHRALEDVDDLLAVVEVRNGRRFPG